MSQTSSPPASATRRQLKLIARAVRPCPKGEPAVGNISEVAEAYDDVFTNVEKHDTLDQSNAPKLKYVLDYARSIDGRVLDAGCGRGSVLRAMIEAGVDVFGIALSPACCEKYLQGLPVENTDIVTHSKAGKRYSGLVCTDVLEHIPPDQITQTLQALKSLSPSAFLGIANHSSIHRGRELHVIQEGLAWWLHTLSDHFRTLTVVVPTADDTVLAEHFAKEIFFFIKVED